jgi:hypothetical protein
MPTRASRSEERWGPGPQFSRAFAPPFPVPRATANHSNCYEIRTLFCASWVRGETIVSKGRSSTLAALMSGGNSHLALRMVKGKWMCWVCEKILKEVLLSLRKSTKNCSGLNLLIRLSLKEEGYVEGASPEDGIIN